MSAIPELRTPKSPFLLIVRRSEAVTLNYFPFFPSQHSFFTGACNFKPSYESISSEIDMKA